MKNETNLPVNFTTSLHLMEMMCNNLNDVYELNSPFLAGIENVNDIHSFSKSELIQLIATIIISVFAFVGNSLVISIVYYNPSLRSTINYYLVNLAVADLLISIFCMWDNVLRSIAYNYLLGLVGCKLGGLIHVMCLLCSVFTLASIAIDRGYAVIYPFQARLSPSKPFRVIAAIWILSCLLATPYCSLLKYEIYQWTDFLEKQCKYNPGPGVFDVISLTCKREKNFVIFYHILMTVLLYFFPALLIILAYIFIVLKLWIFQEFMDGQLSIRIATKKQVVRLAIVVLTAFLACWTPLQALIISSVIKDSQGSFTGSQRDEFWIYLLAYSNSALNPLIYGGLSKSYRIGLMNMIKGTPNHLSLARYNRKIPTTKTTSSQLSSINGTKSFTQRSTSQTSNAHSHNIITLPL